MPFPTVADVLALPEVQRGHPRVAAGRGGLSRPVRWVHVLELSHVEGLLRGGELVLSTGIALPTSNDGLRRYIEDLDRAQASGVLLELGERWTALPPALVRAADRADLPLVGLHTVVPFVAITESVHASIVQASYAELQAAERMHEVFSRLGLEGASPADVVREVAELAGAPVVLESLSHRVLSAAAAGRDQDSVLRDWERRSRRDGRGEGWLVRPVGARGLVWGRLILQPGPDAPPTQVQTLAVERGAAALALGRLVEGDGAVLERRAQAGLLTDLVAGRYRSEREAHLRAQAAGVPTAGRNLTAVAVVAPGTGAAEIAAALERAASRSRLDVLATPVTDALWVLLALPATRPVPAALAALADAVRRELPAAVLGRGPTIAALPQLGSSLQEAEHAARAEVAAGGARPLVGLGDVRVHGLLAQLAGDPRLAAFVERELGALLDRQQPALLAALRAYLVAGRNKSAAAAALRISRPAFYARLGLVADVLHADLEDAGTCLSLQLALVALDAGASSD